MIILSYYCIIYFIRYLYNANKTFGNFSIRWSPAIKCFRSFVVFPILVFGTHIVTRGKILARYVKIATFISKINNSIIDLNKKNVKMLVLLTLSIFGRNNV